MPKVWFVTGSSRGLGRAIATHALNRGDQVVATARRPEQLDDLVAAHGDRVLPVALDVTDAAQADGAVTQAFEQFGQLDIVVNNAGYADTAAVEDISLESFRAQVATNFMGVVIVTKAVLPRLREQGFGHIFQVSSLGGRLGSPGLSAYQSAKWAVGGFSTVLAAEVASLGLQVTVLEPGGMPTDWAGSSMSTPPVSEPYQATVGAFAAMLRGEAHSPPEQEQLPPSDTAKIAAVISDLAGRPDAPLRLLLGQDAVAHGTAAGRALTESDQKWRATSVSVAQQVTR